jgi:integrase
LPTFGAVAGELIASKRAGWRNAVHAAQWEALESYCAVIWQKPVNTIDLVAVLGVLKPLWTRIPETAKRVRGRIETVLNAAKARGLRSGENPAQWRGNLEHLLPLRPRLEQVHHPAMPYSNMPAYVASLRQLGTVPARGLEFMILTAARLGEVRGADWAEIDLAGNAWSIPAARMKAGIAHRVPLSRRAFEILEHLSPAKSGLIFPGYARGRPISPTSLRKLSPAGATLHGFRSSFRDFCAEQTSFSREICEEALAHSFGSPIERAYKRTDLLERRRELMETWAQYCSGDAVGNVIPIVARKG